jgi:putative transposase
MARLPRLYAPAIAQHIVQRAAVGRRLFMDTDDYAIFIDLLRDAARTHGLSIHAFVLLPQRLELVATPASRESTARTLQAVARRFVPRINQKSALAGTLWQGRFRSTLIDADDYLLAVMRYVESRPVAEGLVPEPADWHWSSFAHHVGHGAQSIIMDHAIYWSLSDTPFERQAVYRAMMDRGLDAALAERIGKAAELGWALGGERFVASLKEVANRRPHPAPRGRPAKDRSVPI